MQTARKVTMPVGWYRESASSWGVLVRGAAHHLDTEAERAPIIGAGLEPWIEGVPAHFIRVNPTSTWGNRILRA
jgi:hypothetical protein